MIQTFGPKLFTGGTAPILKDASGNAVLDTNGNGRVDDGDSVVLTRNSVEGCTGQVPTRYDSLQAHAGSLGRATSREVAESMARYENPYVVDVLPQHAPAGYSSTVFHFEAPQPYAEFILQG